MMMQRIADWHGEQAAKAWLDHNRTGLQDDLDKFLRHASIADKLWVRR